MARQCTLQLSNDVIVNVLTFIFSPEKLEHSIGAPQTSVTRDSLCMHTSLLDGVCHGVLEYMDQNRKCNYF